MDSARWAGDDASATWVPGAQGMLATGKGGSTRPNEPHSSQCEPAFGRLPLPESAASGEPGDAVVRVQMPPSLPVRTSCASMDAGATNADRTARKLRNAAKRAHKDGRVQLEDGYNTA
jgi:hypothetical protein